MKVSELIEILNKCDQDLLVIAEDRQSEKRTVTIVVENSDTVLLKTTRFMKSHVNRRSK